MWAPRYWAKDYWAAGYWAVKGGAGVAVVIDGVNRTKLVRMGTLGFADQQENRGNANFTLIAKGPPPYFRPCVGDSVDIFCGDALVYSGSIETFDDDEQVVGVVTFYKVKCTDHSSILDRFLVVKIYDDELAGDIIKDSISEFVAAEEGIDVSNVDDGLLIDRAVFNHRKVSDLIRELSKLVGFSWYVDEFKKLHFEDRTAVPAPFGLFDGSKNYRKLKIKRKRMQYRNRQFVLAGDDTTDLRTEDFAGDSQRQTFTLAFRVAEEPIVTLNAAAQTIGVRGVDPDSGSQWFWRKDDKEITQRASDTPIISTDVLAVTYRGLFPIAVLREDSIEIAGRAAIEGNSGIYENVEDDESIEKRAFAIQKADGLIRRWGNIPTVVTFETDVNGLRSGQIININLSDRGPDMVGDFLIDSVKAKAIPAFTGTVSIQVVRHRIVAVSKEHLGSWVSFYRKLQDSGRRLKLREGETLVIIRNFAEGIEFSETFSTTDALQDFKNDPFTCFQWGSAVEDRAFWGRDAAVGREISGSQFCNPPVDA